MGREITQGDFSKSKDKRPDEGVVDGRGIAGSREAAACHPIGRRFIGARAPRERPVCRPIGTYPPPPPGGSGCQRTGEWRLAGYFPQLPFPGGAQRANAGGFNPGRVLNREGKCPVTFSANRPSTREKDFASTFQKSSHSISISESICLQLLQGCVYHGPGPRATSHGRHVLTHSDVVAHSGLSMLIKFKIRATQKEMRAHNIYSVNVRTGESEPRTRNGGGGGAGGAPPRKTSPPRKTAEGVYMGGAPPGSQPTPARAGYSARACGHRDRDGGRTKKRGEE